MANVPRKTAALIGAGMVAKTHLAACAHSEMVNLKGVTSSRLASARALQETAKAEFDVGLHVYADADEVAADEEVDFAIIVTPPNVREEVIAPLAKAGKGILLEKPVGRNAQEAEEIVRLCRDAAVPLGIVLQHRARAASIKATELVRSGALGRLAVSEFDVPWWREQAYYDEPGRGTYARDGGGVMISQAIHTLDLGLALTGPVSRVTALAKTSSFHQMEAEDYVVAGLEFTNGAVGRFTASTASFPGGAELITLHFDKGSLHLEAGVLTHTPREGAPRTYGAEAGTGGGADPMAFTHEWHQAVIENFVQVLNGQAQPLATGEEALAAHRLIDAIARAAEKGAAEVLPS